MKLSICMMVKNESKHLESCLKSLLPIMEAVESELIIVDTGSTDNTVEIANRYTKKVYFHAWNNNFSEMRNISISYATGEWVFIIDGDEVVDRPADIINFLRSSNSRKFNSANLMVSNLTSEDGSSDAGVFVLSTRFFRRSTGIHYKGAVHNQPVFVGPSTKVDSIIIHYGYISTDKDMMERKFQRTSAILKAELEKDPENIYYWFQLAISYGMHSEFDKALEPIKKAYELVKKKQLEPSQYMYIWTTMGHIFLNLNMFKETEDICLEALRIKDFYVDLHFYLAKARMLMNKNKEAVQSYSSYVNIVENYNTVVKENIFITQYTLGRYEEAYADLSLLYCKLGQTREALDYIYKVKSCKMVKSIWQPLLVLCIKEREYVKLFEYFNQKILQENSEIVIPFLEELEKARHALTMQEAESLDKLFSGIDHEYGILSEIRLMLNTTNEFYSNDLSQKLNNLDFNKLPNYYGDIIYAFLKSKCSLPYILKSVREQKLNEYFEFISSKYDDLCTLIFSYLKTFEKSEGLFDLRINKPLARYALLLNKLDNTHYIELFNRYINDGIAYLEKVYNPEILNGEMFYDVKNEEEAFLICLYHAQKAKANDMASYVKYLRKAISVYPYMKKGIEILLDQIVQKVDNDEELKLDKYRKQIKKVISDLIDQGKIEEAKEIINEYDKLVKCDVEILTIKAVIATMENKFEEAESILLEGLSIEPSNVDLVYNLNYLLSQTGFNYNGEQLTNLIINLIKGLRENIDIVCEEVQLKKDSDNSRIEALAAGFNILFNASKELNENEIILDIDYFNEKLVLLNEAIEGNDRALIGDIALFELKPLLQCWSELIL